MRIMDWSSDVCSSDLVFGVAAEQGVQRQQAGQEHRHPEYAGRDLCQRSRFVAQCKGEQHDYEEGEQGGLQGVAAAAPEAAAVAGDQRFCCDRKSVVTGKSVSVRVVVGGALNIKKKNN